AALVAFRPDADLIAPFVGRQRGAVMLEQPAMRLEFGSFAVEDDAVEVENDGGKTAHEERSYQVGWVGCADLTDSIQVTPSLAPRSDPQSSRAWPARSSRRAR